MIAACYSMDLYCRNENLVHPFWYFPHQFAGETFNECKRKAIKVGWTFQRDGDVKCPLCSAGKKLKSKKDLAHDYLEIRAE